MIGNVFRWDERRKCGLIAPRDQTQVYFHISDFIDRIEGLEVGDLLSFDVERGPRGLRARRIAVVDTEQEAAGAN